MTKNEKTGSRDLAYNNWHRTLGPGYIAETINFVEYREGRGIVALINTTSNLTDENHINNSKKFIFPRTEREREILINTSEALNVPAYFVIHDDGLTIFHVYNLNKGIKTFQKMDKKEYSNFIKSL